MIIELSRLIASKELLETSRDRRVIRQIVVASFTTVPAVAYFSTLIFSNSPSSIVVAFKFIHCQYGLILTIPIGIHMVAGEREAWTLETTFLICRSRAAIALGKVAAYLAVNCCVALILFCSTALGVYLGGVFVNSASMPDASGMLRFTVVYLLYSAGLIPMVSIGGILLGALSKSSREGIGHANVFHFVIGIGPMIAYHCSEYVGSIAIAIPVVNLFEAMQLFVESKLTVGQALLVGLTMLMTYAIGLLFLVRRLSRDELIN